MVSINGQLHPQFSGRLVIDADFASNARKLKVKFVTLCGWDFEQASGLNLSSLNSSLLFYDLLVSIVRYFILVFCIYLCTLLESFGNKAGQR